MKKKSVFKWVSLLLAQVTPQPSIPGENTPYAASPVIISPYGSCLSAAEIRQHSVSPPTTTSLQNINQVFSQELNDALDKFNISVTPEHHAKHVSTVREATHANQKSIG